MSIFDTRKAERDAFSTKIAKTGDGPGPHNQDIPVVEHCTYITLLDEEVYIPKGQVYDTLSMVALG